MPDPKYAEKQLSLAIETLTLDPGDIKQRLVRAYNDHIHVVRRSDIPEPLLGSYDKIVQRLLTKPPLTPLLSTTAISGSVEQTLHFMRRSTAVGIAKEIIHLRDMLRQHVENE